MTYTKKKSKINFSKSKRIQTNKKGKYKKQYQKQKIKILKRSTRKKMRGGEDAISGSGISQDSGFVKQQTNIYKQKIGNLYKSFKDSLSQFLKNPLSSVGQGVVKEINNLKSQYEKSHKRNITNPDLEGGASLLRPAKIHNSNKSIKNTQKFNPRTARSISYNNLPISLME